MKLRPGRSIVGYEFGIYCSNDSQYHAFSIDDSGHRLPVYHTNDNGYSSGMCASINEIFHYHEDIRYDILKKIFDEELKDILS